jgi:ABC-2 type transport system ATP-binding protein
MGLTRAYGDLVALDGLDLELAPGTGVALVGQNGSGKTTALRLMAGVLEPTGGSLRVAGEPAGGPRSRAEIAYVPDSATLYDDLTVAEHVELVAVAHGVGGEDLGERVDALLERFELADRADFLPRALSRGMRQKVQLACALVRPSRILLLDEPVVGLDPPAQRLLRDVVAERLAAGSAVVISTHQLAFARDLCQQALILAEGVVAARGGLGEVFESEAARELGLV